MILIGMFDCPFLRRVVVSRRLLGVPCQHRNWSVVRDFELIRQFNPLGRVPALVQPDGEPLIDSTAILDFLDGKAGSERALLPPAGAERRRALVEWMVGRRMTQADITLTCVFTFLCDALEIDQSWVLYPGLSALSARCEALPEFGELRAKFTPSHASHPSEHDRAAR
jgi:glutathione S-transferase